MTRPRQRIAVRLRALLVTLACLAAGAAAAESWTVQTVAVRDLRDARQVADDLVRLGYDAYTEFAMGTDGRQWVRVRVGCYATRAGASGLANLLRGYVTHQAAVVLRTPGAPARGCVRRLVGFRTPDRWSQPDPGVATFDVEVAGVQGVVRFTSGRWRVLQEPATEALAPGRASTTRFRQSEDAPRPFVVVRHEGVDLFVCPGTLLAQEGDAAIVEHDGTVVACSWDPPLPIDEAGTV